VSYPRAFGPYTLLERLGAGGMSEVDLARRSIGGGELTRFLVIKRMLGETAKDPGFVTMFKDEARITAMLHHHNIAQTYDFGSLDEQFFLAMEFVPGLDLRQVQRAQARRGLTLPPRVVLTVLGELLEGLQYAHEQVDDQGQPLRIVHRDINPRNVMLSLRGEVKVIDFGVAKAEGRLQGETVGHSFKGKFAYMSPEQLELGRRIDGRADLFAVGLMLHELIDGVHPFAGLKEGQILQRLLGPPIRAPRPIPSELDAALFREIHDRALAKVPDLRYPDARSFRRDLEALARPLGGFCSRAELAAFLLECSPGLGEQLKLRLAQYRDGELQPPPPPEAPEPVEPEPTRVKTRPPSGAPSPLTMVAIGLGVGALSALFGGVLLGLGFWLLAP
jgi:serine/threonine protein kinase